MKKTISYSEITKGFFILTIFITLLTLYSCNNCDKETDPCENVTCLNEGVCINGDCECEEGYTGSNCGDQITPTMVRISQIKIMSFPQYNEYGMSWDPDGGLPDIHVKINNTYTYQLHSPLEPFENADYTQDYTYNLPSFIDIVDTTEQHYIALKDDDYGDPEHMASINFFPYINSNGFPTTMFLDAGSGVSFELTLSYVW